MDVLININDEIYRHAKDGSEDSNDEWNAMRAIANGTPLPKGHGRLKDFDKIEWYGCDLEGRGCIEAKGDCSVCNHANCYAKQVRELPTIIEADKEYKVEVITRGNCMICGKELTEGLFFCKECEAKAESEEQTE